MPLKPGGGSHMQLYDSRTGEYTDQERKKLDSNDFIALLSYEYYGENSQLSFHFPVEGIHSEIYCRKFVECMRSIFKRPTYKASKMNYILTYQKGHDKSKFLIELGYSPNRPYELFCEICANTRRDTIEFSRFSSGAFLLKAKTTLKGKDVITAWRLEKDLLISFVTLIPGGHKQWKQ